MPNLCLPAEGLLPDDVAPWMCRPGGPRIVDVCLPADAEALGRLIPGSVRRPHDAVDPDGPSILVCAQGKKLSHGAAARLRAEGCAATHLIGGLEGWIAAGLPSLVRREVPASGLYCMARGDFAAQAFLRWFVARVLPAPGTLMTVAEETVADVADRFEARHLTTPAQALDRFGLGESTFAALARAASEGGLGDLLGGVARLYGSDEAGQRAAFPIFDAAIAGARP